MKIILKTINNHQIKIRFSKIILFEYKIIFIFDSAKIVIVLCLEVKNIVQKGFDCLNRFHRRYDVGAFDSHDFSLQYTFSFTNIPH